MPKKRTIAITQLEYLQECDSCHELFNPGKIKKETVCRKCLSFQQRADLKQRALDYKGGKCIKCGYNACAAALVFHHWIGFTNGYFSEEEKAKYRKSFSLSKKICSWDRYKEELDKCVSLCVRCHSELHSRLWYLDRKDVGIDDPK